MKSALVSAINSGVNSAFAKLPIQVPVNSKIGLNYGLVANPIFTQFFTLPDKGNFQRNTYILLGEFYNLQHYDPCKHCKQPPIPDAATNRMLQLSISDYMLNTLTDVFHKNGDLKVIVKDKDLPNWTPIRLTTQSFKCMFVLFKRFTVQLCYQKCMRNSQTNICKCTFIQLNHQSLQ